MSWENFGPLSADPPIGIVFAGFKYDIIFNIFIGLAFYGIANLMDDA